MRQCSEMLVVLATVAGCGEGTVLLEDGLAHLVLDDQYLVVLADDGELDSNASRLVDRAGGMLLEVLPSVRGFAAHLSPEAYEALLEDPSVAHVEPDLVVRTTELQPSPPWHLDRIDQGALPLDRAYAYDTTGATVHAYVIDTGLRPTHVQLLGRASADVSTVNDGLGAEDCNGHGTHVAGALGGSSYGVAKGVFLHGVRAIGCDGSGSSRSVIAAVEWVVANHQRPAIINMSLGAPASTLVNAAVQRAIDAGITVVTAAGNDGDDACKYSPSSVREALTVGASDDSDVVAAFSNFGSCVDLHAPGVGIRSSLHSSDTAYGYGDGTSMASPLVAGAVARFLETDADADALGTAAAIVGAATRDVLSSLASGSPNLLLRTSVATAAEPEPEPEPEPTPEAPTADEAPYASFTSRCPKAGCTFDASGSSDDRGVVSYGWDFGDGSAPIVRSSPLVSYRYPSRGVYSVVLTVTDASGQTGRTQRVLSIKRSARD